MKAVIMAGGKGTRIANIAPDTPKPMIPIMGKPILAYQIDCLRRQGLNDIVIVVGHLGSIIMDYFQDGNRFGVSIRYFCEKEPLGTAGALFQLKDELTNDFILINGDIIFDVDFSRMAQYHLNCGGLATILTHPNDHPYDSALIVAQSNGRVSKWLHKEDERTGSYKNRVNAGIHILSPRLLTLYPQEGKKDMDRDILKPLIRSGMLFAYDSPEYVKDMGTPERYRRCALDILSGNVERKNFCCRQRAVFLDRDGTINEYRGFITKPEQMTLLPGAAEAIARINKSGYLVIVITNQPVIARGECTVEELEAIHNRLETLLGQQGAYLDAIYYCPHHPDRGFAGERPELKITCDCRKPKPGLLMQAAQAYNIDLSESYMVGDQIADVQAGQAAGCRTVLLCDGKTDGIPDQTECFPDLYTFTKKLLNEKEQEV